MPHANSTTSNPLPISPSASSKVFPCSCEISLANSFCLNSIISFNLNIFLDLTNGVILDHSGKMLSADFTASSTQFAVPDTTLDISSPVAGLYIGVEDKFRKSAFLPLIK